MTLRPEALDRSLVGGPLDFDPVWRVECTSNACLHWDEHSAVAMATMACGHTQLGCGEQYTRWTTYPAVVAVRMLWQCLKCPSGNQFQRMTKVEVLL